MADIPNKEMTHKIIGFLYKIYNELGYGYNEKTYQSAFAQLLKKENIKYSRELYLPIKFEDKIIGKQFLDFNISDILIVELKICDNFYKQHIHQVLAYLKNNNLRLGLLVLFTKSGIRIKRLII